MLDNTEYIDKLYENLHHQIFTPSTNVAHGLILLEQTFLELC
ncbi:hypothetical protein ECHHL_0819 [Ehrlichia chaffeensis str. Heartland]|nr:hypothetical protein ECHHL_0819 [Ehrlichia chaffeensis str. Heartland]AHX05314.1 hypothetical protein ECHJAX_0228 [Ehrlichia chaffeensis str. Jax]AHX08095.1 hypothetical protein ECHSTV_0222 [Ehrlichia chaffeensis str. Saint Vincent]AHX09283.1 hypothetical protein ECHWAK_0224 [Ehrlichia chaffeensis str. Wakulla]AHX10604.1 hypothetical protein ECHWP_0815 [Ehrlichia chaffeensis str. West Paces]